MLLNSSILEKINIYLPRKDLSLFLLIDNRLNEYYKNNVKRIIFGSEYSRVFSEYINLPKIKDGKHLQFHRNGNKDLECNFKHGKLDGKHEVWHKNGNKIEKSYFKDGIRNGKYKTYHKRGNLMLKFSIENGLKHGKYLFIDKFGYRTECYYEKDKEKGNK